MPAMKLQLYGLGQVPPTVPMWELIMEDLAFPDEGSLMRVLGVEVELVREWNRSGRAPKWACLALFWLTRWGRAEVHQQATSDAIVALQCLRAVERERDDLALAVNVMRNGLGQLGLIEAPVGHRLGDELARLEVSEHDGAAPGALREGQVSVPRRGLEPLSWPKVGRAGGVTGRPRGYEVEPHRPSADRRRTDSPLGAGGRTGDALAAEGRAAHSVDESHQGVKGGAAQAVR